MYTSPTVINNNNIMIEFIEFHARFIRSLAHAQLHLINNRSCGVI